METESCSRSKGTMASDKSMAIRKLTLFNNGYGVFEREVAVTGRGNIDLFFKGSEMKDVLQSLYFSGGSGDIGNISYESTKTTPSISLTETTPMVSLLRSLRGCSISLVYNDKLEEGKKRALELEGQVLGVDERDSNSEALFFVSLLLTGGIEMKTVLLDDVISVKLLNSTTREDLQHALDQAQASKKPDMQKLTIFYKDAVKERPLTVKYGIFVAEWKSSYRMVFLNNSGKFRLNGYAIVSNTMEEDWNDIGLTLVVGNPSYTPDDANKDTKSRPGRISLAIKLVGSETSFNISIHPAQSVFDLKQEISRVKAIPVSEQKILFAGKECAEGRPLSDYNVQSGSCLRLERRATARASGTDTVMRKRNFVMAQQDGLSYYPIEMSVSAKRQQTAIVPLMKAELEGQLVTVYDDSVRKGNPMSAVLFENTTGRTLEHGTLQVMDETVFLGEGTLPNLGKGDESAPIPYAVELGVEVSVSHKLWRFHNHEIQISGGFINLSYYRQQTSLYAIKNLTSRQLDFMLHHAFLDGWQLFDHEEEGVQPVDITDRVYQFRFDVNAATSIDGGAMKAEDFTFPVREQVLAMDTIDVEKITEDQVKKFVKQGTIPKKSDIHKNLAAIIEIRERVNAYSKMIYEKETELREINSTQQRLREHMKALGKLDHDATEYIKSLSAAEDDLKKAEADIKALKTDKKAESRKLDSKVHGVKYSQKDIPAPPAEAAEET